MKMSIIAKARRRGPHSDETRRKMSAAAAGRVKSEEHCKNISAAKTGKSLGPPSVEHRRKLSLALTGLTKSEEHRRKLSEATKAYYAKSKLAEART